MNIIKSTLPENVNLGEYVIIQENVTIGLNTRICNFVNLYGCVIGNDCMIGPFVEIQSDAFVGNKTRVSSHSFICSRVRIGEDCFIAHGVMFTNDTFANGKVNFDQTYWKETVVGNNVIIGSNATILPVTIGNNCIIGAGSVVLKDVPDNAVVAGNPAKIIKYRKL